MTLKFLRLILIISTFTIPGLAYADSNVGLAAPLMPATAGRLPTLTPTTPNLDAKSYLLMDADTGKILAEQNADVRLAPASLTKMMTSYIVAKAIREGRIHFNDTVKISEKAWRTGGSKMFVKVGESVPVRELVQGIIVDSGNDACVAMAEFIAGSEEGFANLMNQQAATLGMTNTHFMDSTGMPNPQHYMSAHDAALLARALIKEFPEDYKWYSQKWFTHNGIKQPNRNRLLWRDSTADGIKTGHTNEAGFCLVASALRNNTRLISVVMGTRSDASRTENSQNLLNYGYRFFETHKLYDANVSLTKMRIWKGQQKEATLGLIEDFFVTTPIGQFTNIKIHAELNSNIKAPIKKGQVLGNINVTANGEKIGSAPLVALQEIPKGGLWTRMSDTVALGIHHLFNQSNSA